MDFNNKKYQELAVGLNLNVFDLIRHYKLNGFISEEENGNLFVLYKYYRGPKFEWEVTPIPSSIEALNDEAIAICEYGSEIVEGYFEPRMKERIEPYLIKLNTIIGEYVKE